MNVKKLWLPLAAAAVLTVPSMVSAQAKPDALPKGVTEKMISEGATLFAGAGTCFACHGQDAKGVPNLGANLTDEEWVNGDGEYEDILKTIMEGTQSETGAVMPPKGGSLTDVQVKAVAAYVWSLTHKK